MKIADLPLEAKPREKAFCYGIETLHDDELLAILIGSGVKGYSAIDIGKSLINTFVTLPNLANSSLDALEKMNGLNKISALKLIASFELHRRLISPLYCKNNHLHSSQQINDRFRYLETYENEVIVLVMLNRKKEIIREMTKYKGTGSLINFDFKEIISELLKSNCKYFVLVHNHPSGEEKPSQNDVISTFVLKEKAYEFGIKLFDHVVIYKNGYYSFLEHGHFH